jgi:hypothetical protein
MKRTRSSRNSDGGGRCSGGDGRGAVRNEEQQIIPAGKKTTGGAKKTPPASRGAANKLSFIPQFHHEGKITYLGTFDTQKEAARAYDRMALWCELHGETVKGQFELNYDRSEYESEVK